jgi:D-lyxose ketol-isomerase
MVAESRREIAGSRTGRKDHMKRSQINAVLSDASSFVGAHGFHLPPFAHWTPDTFRAQRAEVGGVVERGLGWDVTDFGRGRFESEGLVLFTMRNGRLSELRRGGGMLYAEKIIVLRAGQTCPMHRHDLKTEDIINRGGGSLALQLFMSASRGGIDAAQNVTVETDGRKRSLPAGATVHLEAGESITLRAGIWHAFWAEREDVLVGEVSTVNDDQTDNVFRDPIGRFPEIEEDTAPTRLLTIDYARWLG